MTDLLVRGARLVPVASRRPRAVPAPPAGVVDVRVEDGRVVEVGPGLRGRGEELDAEGRWLVPGLWDQHVHSGQWARSFTRVDVSSAASAADAVAIVRAAVAGRPPAPGVLLEGYGFRDALWQDVPTTTALDAAAGDVPVVLVSGDVHCGWLSSAAMARLGVPHRDGLVREHEWFDVLARIGRLPHAEEAGLRAALGSAAERGVVGIVDVEFAANHRRWPERVAAGLDTLRVRTGVYTDDLDDVLAAGLRTGAPLPGGAGLLTMGPVKVITDGALNTRTAHCHDPYSGGDGTHGEQTVPAAELRALMRRASAAGLTTAVHAIGDASVTIALDAYAATGARGTLEHAQLVTAEDVARFARLGVAASVQPAHLLDDRDVAEAYWAGRAGRTFPLRDLLDAGTELRFGSDAPVAPLDPWLAMAAAVSRTGDERPPWTPEQRITPAEALAASTDGWGTVAPGHPGDLVLLDADPLSADLRTMPVATTILAGRVTHDTR
ncbi:amidohydrolase family protein [Georgenia wutianyii]|uniref:Amidohydrolase family protein n=1 Tax=Georgenia wutianyii TaxID=2585135 RepID=A0ABX5VKL2_9MICO|nr:amidohydrolase family protein [Georgenia wutianyii]QDB78221.1 amidohydrolase family protein [Georgenia wutianyii]